MKFAHYLASFAIVALALSLSAFAKDGHSGNFTLADTVQVGSTELAPGNYKAEWSGPANDVKVAIMKNGKTVATAPGQIKDLQRPSPYDAVMMKTLSNDTKTIGEIDFSNRTEALVLGGE
jgi:hypothetical protein